MAMRTCPKCKWEYPDRYNRSKCRYCDTLLDSKICVTCGVLLPIKDFYYYKRDNTIKSSCIPCERKRRALISTEVTRNWLAKKKKSIEEKYEQWMELTNVDFKPLKEEDWLKTCSYFGGCAICGSKHIESREFFVPFQVGGKYTSWNVFPLCGQCRIATKKFTNPFMWLDNYYGRWATKSFTPERKQRLVDYLRQQIERSEDK